MSTPRTDPVRAWIRRLALAPHPEGGWYREVWRAGRLVEEPGTGVPRPAGTSIYYLLDVHRGSRFHRIRSDEVWALLDGGPLHVHVLHADGRVDLRRLSGRVRPGAEPQTVVPAGAWFGAEVAPGGRFALAACLVAPGFEFGDLEFARREVLLARYPRAAAVIRRLT